MHISPNHQGAHWSESLKVWRSPTGTKLSVSLSQQGMRTPDLGQGRPWEAAPLTSGQHDRDGAAGRVRRGWGRRKEDGDGEINRDEDCWQVCMMQKERKGGNTNEGKEVEDDVSRESKDSVLFYLFIYLFILNKHVLCKRQHLCLFLIPLPYFCFCIVFLICLNARTHL